MPGASGTPPRSGTGAGHPDTNDLTLTQRMESLLVDFFGQENGGGGILAPLVLRLEELDVVDLARMTVMWTQRLDSGVNRRELISKLSAALMLAGVAPSCSLGAAGASPTRALGVC
jgi:hypothetical protein